MHANPLVRSQHYSGTPIGELPQDLLGRVTGALETLAQNRWAGKLCVTALAGRWPIEAQGFREYAIFDNGQADEIYIKCANGGTFLLKFADGGDTITRLAAQRELGVMEPASLTGRPGTSEWVIIRHELGGSGPFSPVRTGPIIGIPVGVAA